jgi:hypothetical protein
MLSLSVGMHRTARQSAAPSLCLPCVSLPAARVLWAPRPCTQPSPCQRGARCVPSLCALAPPLCVCVCVRAPCAFPCAALACSRAPAVLPVCVCVRAAYDLVLVDRADYVYDLHRDAAHVLYPPLVVAVFENPFGECRPPRHSRRGDQDGDQGQRQCGLSCNGGPAMIKFDLKHRILP